MQRIVIDASFAVDSRLGDWLERAGDNIAILTEYFYIEAYRRGDPHRVQESFAQLGRRPAQVHILNSTDILSRLPPKASGATRRMINDSATREFQKFIKDIQRLKSDDGIKRAVEDHIRAANHQMNEGLAGVEGLGDALKALASSFPDKDLRAMRRGEKYSSTAIKTMMVQLLDLTKAAFQSQRTLHIPGDKETLAHSYIFRLSLCCYLVFKYRIEKGAVGEHLRNDHAKNDLVDATYAASALYFDGLRTNDATLAACFSEARYLMTNIFLPNR